MICASGAELGRAEWRALVDEWLSSRALGRRVLIVPPDDSRCHSYAGEMTAYLYERLHAAHDVHVMPAVGTHAQMSASAKARFFPNVPAEAFLEHDWRRDAETLGEIASETVERATGGRCLGAICVQLNRRVARGEFDEVLSIGQVVPHEVVGMANYTKNLLVGLGGREMINRSHMIGAICGLESCMGKTETPVRALLDDAQERFLNALGVTFFLSVVANDASGARLRGLFIGEKREAFEAAAQLSQQLNVTTLERRVRRVVTYLDPAEFRSLWVGNKAIYRTRMAIADGGELLVIAPALRQCGENEEADALIRRYGYCGTPSVLKLYREHAFDGMEMVAAHLIHGSGEGRFRIVYATDPALMPAEEIKALGFGWADARDALARYRPQERETGFYNDENGAYYYVSSPALGLWRARD